MIISIHFAAMSNCLLCVLLSLPTGQYGLEALPPASIRVECAESGAVRVADCYSGDMKSMPTRVDGELYEVARSVARTQSRSAAQQIDHWARIGRELEASPNVTNMAVQHVLTGEGSYDALSEQSQAVVRAAWEERIAAGLAGLNLAAELRDAGDAWAEGDANGDLIVRDPRGTSA